jgi:deazaflavin-dependent oxidoreductase (nitroreductase family)
MPLPRSLARLNRRFTNRITGRVAGRLPAFAIVVHKGRVSGRVYRTPVNAFRRRGGGYVIALTYGPDSQWARNVRAQGGCVLETMGRRLQATNPRTVRDPTRQLVPPPVRPILGLLGVDQFMELDTG